MDGGRANPGRSIDIDPLFTFATTLRHLLVERVALYAKQRKLDSETRSDTPRKGDQQVFQRIPWRAYSVVHCQRAAGVVVRANKWECMLRAREKANALRLRAFVPFEAGLWIVLLVMT